MEDMQGTNTRHGDKRTDALPVRLESLDPLAQLRDLTLEARNTSPVVNDDAATACNVLEVAGRPTQGRGDSRKRVGRPVLVLTLSNGLHRHWGNPTLANELRLRHAELVHPGVNGLGHCPPILAQVSLPISATTRDNSSTILN